MKEERNKLKSSTIIIDINQAKQIGKKHNSVLKSALDSSIVNVSLIKKQFNAYPLPSSITQNLRDTLMNNQSVKTMEVDVKKSLSKLGETYYDKAKHILLSNVVYQTASNKLDILETNIKSQVQLTDKEKSILYVFIEVGRSSLKLWLPKSEGGEGFGIGVYGDKVANINWRNVGIADSTAAASVFTGYGLLFSLTGPMSFGALIAVVGWSSACSSAVAMGF